MNATQNEIRIGRITYKVTTDQDSDGVRYNLRGPRGSHLRTMRNFHDKALMFLVNARTCATEQIWFTDKNGMLERVEVM